MLTPRDFEKNASTRKFFSVLKDANTEGVTDIELVADAIVRYAVVKKLRLHPGKLKLEHADIKEVLDFVMPLERRAGSKDVLTMLPLGFSFSVMDTGHYRVVSYRSRQGVAMSIRKLPYTIPDIEMLGIPKVVSDTFFKSRNGLFLVTGPTGSGKTTTIVSLLEHENCDNNIKIITLENPVEFRFLESKAQVQQLELGTDIRTLEDGLYYILHSNPAIMFLGEIRSPEEARACLRAGETAHRVITSYHVPDSASAIERLLHEVGDTPVARRILANSLIAVLNQRMFVRPVESRGNGNEEAEGGSALRFFYAWEFLPVAPNPQIVQRISSGDFEGIRTLFDKSNAQKRRDSNIISFKDSIDELTARGIIDEKMLRDYRYYDFLDQDMIAKGETR